MNPYAKGNRDGLLAFAAECEERAKAAGEDAGTWARGRPGGYADRFEVESLQKASVWREAAALARTRAEALPEEPE